MKKTILYIHHGKGIGGAPLSLLYLIRALDKERFHPIVLFLHSSPAIDLFKAHGIEVVGPVNRYDFPHTRIWWLRWYHAPFFITAIRDTIITRYYLAAAWFDKIKPDIVHLNTSSLIAWGIAARKKNIPVVWHIRESLAAGYCGLRKRLVTNIISKHASAIIPICNHDALPWKMNTKTHIVYNAVAPDIFNYTYPRETLRIRHQLSTTTPTILFLGGLSREKGTDLILTVFEELRLLMPDVHLLIAGYFSFPPSSWKLHRWSPSYRFEQRVKKLYQHNATAITLLGPTLNIQEAFAATDVVVFPATVGHFARPIIEAGFMKKPVIASHLAPLDELVIDGETGYLLSPTAPHDWVATLLAVLQSRSEQKRLGENAYHFCSQKFSLTHQQELIASLYQSLGDQ